MLKIGLTGSIGSGKSTVARIFEVIGVDVFYADAEARLLLQEPEVRSEIVQFYGEKVLDENSRILRKQLAKIVFNDPHSLRVLNELIHPRIKQKLARWLSERISVPYALQEAAILFESGFSRDCDAVITVSAPEELRLERVMARDRITRDEVLARMKNQWSDEEKASKADFVIINDGGHLVIPQVLRIHEELLFRSKIKDRRSKIKDQKK